MKKIAIIINGRGGVGKDTLCAVAATQYKVRNISSVDPIKDIAKFCGWNPRVKDDKARRFLSDLKAVTISYNDFPTNWCLGQYREFLASPDEQVFFCHIREPEEIAKFVAATDGAAKALLVRAKNRLHNGNYGNVSDDRVEEYAYDYYFDNDAPRAEAGKQFLTLLARMIAEN